MHQLALSSLSTYALRLPQRWLLFIDICWFVPFCAFLSFIDLLAIGNILACRQDGSHQTINWGIVPAAHLQPEPWVALSYKDATWARCSRLSHERSRKAKKQRRPDKSAKKSSKPPSQQKHTKTTNQCHDDAKDKGKTWKNMEKQEDIIALNKTDPEVPSISTHDVHELSPKHSKTLLPQNGIFPIPVHRPFWW